jgi:hypothetical protein
MITAQRVGVRLEMDEDQLTRKKQKKVKCSHKEEKRNVMSQLYC